jgi:hypothetical protein
MWSMSSRQVDDENYLCIQNLLVSTRIHIVNGRNRKFESRARYLSPELVTLALYSKNVSVSEKSKIQKALQQCKEDWEKRTIKLFNTKI